MTGHQLPKESKKRLTVLGIGNILMGDEGVGIHIVRHLEKICGRPDVRYVDGGTGGFHLLDYFASSDLVLIIDATVDGKEPGSVTRLFPHFSRDYPRTLVSHDIGLKDMLDALQLLEKKPETVLFTVTIKHPVRVSMDLSPGIQEAVSTAAERICAYLKSL